VSFNAPRKAIAKKESSSLEARRLPIKIEPADVEHDDLICPGDEVFID
jgi:hypothetical protein